MTSTILSDALSDSFSPRDNELLDNALSCEPRGSLIMSTSHSEINNIVGLGSLRMSTSNSECCWFRQFENAYFPF